MSLQKKSPKILRLKKADRGHEEMMLKPTLKKTFQNDDDNKQRQSFRGTAWATPPMPDVYTWALPILI